MSYWRQQASPIIARVLAETRGQDERAIRRALRDAYPFGERAMHPYKIWLSEIRRQRGGGRALREAHEVSPDMLLAIRESLARGVPVERVAANWGVAVEMVRRELLGGKTDD